MPVVDTVDPRVVAFLADKCGYGVEVVPAGAPFDPPTTLIDETSTPARDDREHPPDELAISTADLQKYLSQGGDFEDDAVNPRQKPRRKPKPQAPISPLWRLRGVARRA